MLPALYHAHHDRHLEDLPFWLKLADQAGDPLLELGCGTGRLLIPLAQAGHRVVGLDNDPSMLRYLKSTPTAQSLPHLSILAGDMCNFRLAEQFRLILLPCNTFSTLNSDQRQACLGCIRRQLVLGGTFALSLPNPRVLASLPPDSGPELEDEFIHPQTGNPVQVSSSWHRVRSTFTVTWSYDQLFPDGRVERATMQAAHHIVLLDDYLDEFRAAGLAVKATFGDFDCSAYAADSPHLIILATT